LRRLKRSLARSLFGASATDKFCRLCDGPFGAVMTGTVPRVDGICCKTDKIDKIILFYVQQMTTIVGQWDSEVQPVEVYRSVKATPNINLQ
jgi:predicted molibdopterin-dependent oxidoreductase YjgC